MFRYVKILISQISLKNISYQIKIYKYETIIIVGYIFITLSVIQWGLPSKTYPFPYFMDETHLLQVLETVVKHGTSNYPPHENGPMFYYVFCLILISPLYLFHIIDPSAITSAISSIEMQRTIYMYLRIETLIYGVLTAFFLIKVSKILKFNTFFTTAFFILTPVWLLWSNYFKFEIALAFWMVVSLYVIFMYAKSPKKNIFYLAGIVAALTGATKISGIVFLLVYILSFFNFTDNPFKKIKTLFIGLFIYIATFIIYGIPDIIFAGRSMIPLLYGNIVSTPYQMSKSYSEGYSHVLVNIFQLMPAIFGHFFFWLFIASLLFLIAKISMAFLQRRIYQQKIAIFLLLSLGIFAGSLSPLWFVAANRALVLLPFMVLIVGFCLEAILNNSSKFWKRFIVIILILGLIIQIFESYSWIALKFSKSSQQISSAWIVKNIPKKSVIGIMNIPVYDTMPEIIIDEFYKKLYKINKNYSYDYQLIDSNTSKLPRIIVLSNAQFEYLHMKSSPKKSLLSRMYKEGYHEIQGFSPTVDIYKTFVSDDFVFTQLGLIAYPLRISVFRKN